VGLKQQLSGSITSAHLETLLVDVIERRQIEVRVPQLHLSMNSEKLFWAL
jgi:hypothetical protein